MYKKLFLYSLILFQAISNGAFAQKGEKVESVKIAFLSEKLNLDPKTAEKFWPIYNQYDDEMRNVIQESRKANDNRSAEEILDQEQKALDIKRKYSILFNKVISNEQLAKMYKAEREFYQILIRRKNKMENRQQMQQNRQQMQQNRQQMQNNPDSRMQERPRMIRPNNDQQRPQRGGR